MAFRFKLSRNQGGGNINVGSDQTVYAGERRFVI
jgi:hypothetical protein